MRLTYKLLWIDNDDSIYKNHQDDIYEHLEDLGFAPQIEILQDFNSFEEAKLDLNTYDLFILDYKLKNGQNGNKIVEDIRNNQIYTEIIFYSAVPEEARKQIFDDKLNGVYITSREYDEFENDVLGIIDVTIKKTQDVNNLRGLIMAEVAELDRIKEKIIIKGSNKISDKAIEKYTLKKIKESGTSNQNKAKRFLENIENITFEPLFQSLGFVDSDKKAKATGEILAKLGISEPITKDAFIQPYIDNILGKRNKFAHVEECDGFDEDGVACKVIGDIPFTEKKCIEIRKEIKKYKNILIQIEQKIEEA